MKRQGAKIYNLFLKRSKSGTSQAQDEKESGTHCPSPGQSEQRSSFSGLRSSHMLTSAVIFQIQVSYVSMGSMELDFFIFSSIVVVLLYISIQWLPYH